MLSGSLIKSDGFEIEDTASDLFSGVRLSYVFADPATCRTRRFALDFIHRSIASFPAPAPREIEHFVGEEFYLLMPTQAAFECELKLCRAISQADAKSDLDLSMCLRNYLDTHIFINIPGKREVKRGDAANWYDGSLLRVTTGSDSFVCNPIQFWLFHLLNPVEKGTYCYLD